MKSERSFEIKPTLKGSKVVLRPFQQEDITRMLEILSDPEVRHLTGSVGNDAETRLPILESDIERFTKWYESRNEQKDRLDLAVVDKETGVVVGEVVLNEYDEGSGNVNFRILIGAVGRSRGFGSEATELILRYGFEVLNLHKIGLEVFSFNPRAEHVYRKNGFVLEGIKREDIMYNDEYFDTLIFGMLKTDYDRRRNSRYQGDRAVQTP